MTVLHPLTCRGVRWEKLWALATAVSLLALTIERPGLVRTAHAQAAPLVQAPTGQGFVLEAGDLRFIYEQILVAQDHAAGGTLLGPGPNQVVDPQLPRGLRTVDGSFNNLVPGQNHFGAADLAFPRLTTPVFRTAEALPLDPDGPGPQVAGGSTSYGQKKGFVIDSQARLISNLVVDQSANNPAAVAAAENPCGEGGFVCSGSSVPDPDSGALFIPNITPDFGLSAPFNLTFTFFGQFFDHGLDLVTKGGGLVIIPLYPDDPLYVEGSDTNFMVVTRGQNQPGPDGIRGDIPDTPEDESADDIQEATNTTTPWVDQNQTYTSHPSHQVFLREYALNAAGRPVPNGKVLDGGFCTPRPNGIPGDDICNIGNWAQVKAQAAAMLGIRLTDQDVFNVPLLLTDPYGHFKPGANGFPQMVLPGNVLVEGNPAANGGEGLDIPPDALKSGHAFLDDIAHNAAPNPGLVPDPDGDVSVFGVTVQLPGTYDDELLDLHFVTGDGRGNENIALTAIHQLFHAEHNRLVHDIDRLIPLLLTPEEVEAWHSDHAASGWSYGERLFQAARFVTEMEYQHLVFEEFARKVQPLINPFLGGITSINGAISAEFAHTVYRLGHSMLPEVVGRMSADGTSGDVRLLHAFLNPVGYNDGGPLGALNAAQAAGSIVRGTSRQVANELDEFVTSSVRNTLLGLPLDLAAINIARGRSEGIPPLNEVRRQFFNATRNSAVAPYANWFEFGLSLRHSASLVNFVAAYGTHPTLTGATTAAAKRNAARTLVETATPFMFEAAETSGLNNVDFWVGGLAERQAVFGGLLGSTFNFVFEMQLEHLQDGDRFYYLQRTDGLNLKTQLEGNSLAELARRNSDVEGTMDVVFDTADFNLDVASFPGTTPVDLGDGAWLLTLFDGTKLFFDPEHRGKNIVFNGSAADDRMQADIGDDSMFGNGGNDRIEGGEGNDTLVGGDGDDMLFGQNGDDVLKGGSGNDAMSAGPGFGADLLLGADGNDFMIGGDDGDEYFAGPGQDFVLDGSTRSEAIVGGSGDDWLDGGDGHDGGMFGDDGNVFDLLAGLDIAGGHDVMDGAPGQDNLFGEGGDDIFLMSEGSNKFFGDFGFDWITQRGWPAAADIELDLFALAGVPLNFNDLRNKYRLVDGASGWNLNDHIRGDQMVNDPAAPIEFRLLPGMELTAVGAARISGLTELVNAFGMSFPFMGGNILLGGGGSDVIEGKAGDDLIDGDQWLNVQLEATMNDGTVRRVDRISDLVDDVLSDPQRLNPGNIRILRSIVAPVAPPVDCGVATPLNCDTAVFTGLETNYAVRRNANGTVTVTHTAGVGQFGVRNDGTDTLKNIEQLRFADVTVPISAPVIAPVSLPSVVGETFDVAISTLSSIGLTASITTANSATVPAGIVIAQTPIAGTSVSPGTAVSLVLSAGPANVLVPNVVGQTEAAARTAVAGAGLTVGTITTANSTVAPAGTVIGQNPAAGTSVAPGSAVGFVVSLGPVPQGLVLALNFDEASGATAVDSSGGARSGVITGAVRVPGRAGAALSFDGVDDWVTVADAEALDLSTGMTIEAWVNPATLSGWESIVLKEDGAGLSYALYAHDGAPFAGGVAAPAGYVRAGGGDQAIRGAAALTPGAWTHLATTYDGANQRLYVNGALVATRPQTGPIGISTGALRIGGNSAFAGEFFEGLIDDVRIYNRALSAAELALDMGGTVVTEPVPPPPPPPPSGSAGLVLALGFDEASGLIAADSSGGGRNGTIREAARVPGKVGGALSFDGVDDWVTVADAEALDLSTGMTIEAWVNPTTLSGWESILLKEDGAGLSYALYAHDGAPLAGGVAAPAGYVRVGGGDQAIRGAAALTPGTWTHLATTYDGTNQRLYVNGALVATRPQTGPIGISTGAVRIGGNSAFAGEFFEGLIDDVRLYNRALSAAELALDMGGTVVTEPVPPPPPPPPSGSAGLVLALGFDEASGLIAADSSGGGRNGTIREAARVPGKVGGALSFDGVDDWVTVADAEALDLSTGMTIEAWVNPTTLSGWESILLKEDGAGLSYALYAHDGAPLAGGVAAPAGYVRVGGGDQAIRGGAALTPGTWTHLATTYDGTNQRLYVNGALVATRPQTGPITISTGALRIGGNSAFAGEFFEGLIDEVRLYNRALSAAEIAAEMTPIGGTGQ